ncbi:MAG TPA: hypothetical protein VIH90_01010 [Candidatus Saccharimonadales bacterium]
MTRIELFKKLEGFKATVSQASADVFLALDCEMETAETDIEIDAALDHFDLAMDQMALMIDN